MAEDGGGGGGRGGRSKGVRRGNAFEVGQEVKGGSMPEVDSLLQTLEIILNDLPHRTFSNLPLKMFLQLLGSHRAKSWFQNATNLVPAVEATLLNSLKQRDVLETRYKSNAGGG